MTDDSAGFFHRDKNKGKPMNISKTSWSHPLAALLLLASCSVLSAAEVKPWIEASQDTAEVAATIQPAAALVDSEAALQACHFGMCKEPSFDTQKIDTVMGSDVLPRLRSPAVITAEGEGQGC